MTAPTFDRILNPPRNVGGSDLVTRACSTILMLVLGCIVVPQAGVSYPILKITLLTVTEVGLSSLMVGLFVNAKTYAAGLQLFVAPLMMLWLVQHRLAYAAAGVGMLSTAGGLVELLTRRSRLNSLLGISSTGEAQTGRELDLHPESATAARRPS
jgi:hypothetical protein